MEMKRILHAILVVCLSIVAPLVAMELQEAQATVSREEVIKALLDEWKNELNRDLNRHRLLSYNFSEEKSKFLRGEPLKRAIHQYVVSPLAVEVLKHPEKKACVVDGLPSGATSSKSDEYRMGVKGQIIIR